MDLGSLTLRAYGDCHIANTPEPSEPPLELCRLNGSLPVWTPQQVLYFRRSLSPVALHKVAPIECLALQVDGHNAEGEVQFEHLPRHYWTEPLYDGDSNAMRGEDLSLTYYATSPRNHDVEPERILNVYFDTDQGAYEGLCFDAHRNKRGMTIPEYRAMSKIFMISRDLT
jgi:hypothetical protein